MLQIKEKPAKSEAHDSLELGVDAPSFELQFCENNRIMKFILRFFTLALLGSNVPNLYAQPYYMWATEIGGTQTDVGNSISSDGASNVIVCGRFQGTIDANPAAGTQNPMTSAGDFDMMVVKFNAQGAFQWAKNAGGPGFDEYTMVKTDADDNVYLFGSFEQSIDLDPNDATVNYTSAGGAIWY